MENCEVFDRVGVVRRKENVRKLNCKEVGVCLIELGIVRSLLGNRTEVSD